MLYTAQDESCHDLLSQGPCQDKEILIYDEETMLGNCIHIPDGDKRRSDIVGVISVYEDLSEYLILTSFICSHMANLRVIKLVNVFGMH